MNFKRNILLRAVILLMIISTQRITFAQDEPENLEVLDDWLEWSNAGNLLELHLYDQGCNYLDMREEEIARLDTKSDWQKRQQHVRKILQEIVGPFPEKTPLNPRIMGVVQKDGYHFEKIIFESMPNYYVTGCLFIPDGITDKRPAILYAIGHSMESFRRPYYQTLLLKLVKQGFIVFTFDPMGQGERIQYTDAEKESVGVPVGSSTREHSYANNQLLLAGASAARYFTWDGIRAIDYLMTRGEVDTSKIGVTGLSGGGTQTAYISAFDDRVKAAAPSGYITNLRRVLGMIGPQDGEQIFIGGVAKGLDHADLVEVFAPKPYLIVATTRDFFNIVGVRETYVEAEKAYFAFGKPENLNMVEDDFRHGYTAKNRNAICHFFGEVFDMPTNVDDFEPETSEPDELVVTSTGQLATYLNGETISSVNKGETVELIARVKENRKNSDVHLENVKAKARELSGYQTPCELNDVMFKGRYHRDGYNVELYAIRGEGDYVIPILVMVPADGEKHPAMIYLHPEGKITDAAPGEVIEKWVKRGFIVAATDVIGIGETKGDYDYPGRPGYGAVMIERSIVGIHAGDIVRVVNLLKTREDVVADQVGAVAYDELCPALLHAAAFEPTIEKTVLINAPVSYSDIVNHRLYKYSLTFMWGVAGALTEYDLPDLAAAIAPRELLFAEPVNCMKEPAAKKLIDEELQFPKAVYLKKDVSDNLKISNWTVEKNVDEIIAWVVK
ncbi:xylan esterase [candidate division KSB1 bacterium]|nr:xylan esterase [candidate division KSB1 bacterium]